jgi:HK97 gp10 family phage protein
MLKISASADTSVLTKAGPSLQDQLEKIVAKTTLHIERQAKILAPVDTGFLRNSIYSDIHGTSGRGAAIAAAKRQNASAGVTQALDAEPTRFEGYVIAAAEYAAYVNYGTAKMAARPFLTIAAWQERKRFRDEVAKAIRQGVK